MLKELKVKLEQVRGVEVSQATISRALHNYGYSGKKVCDPLVYQGDTLAQRSLGALVYGFHFRDRR